MNEEIFVETANSAIDSLVKEIHKLQEPKTPTKEQIDYIRKQMDLLSTPLEDIPVIVIEIWEKIKNPKRLRLEVGKTYIARDGSEVKIIYKSPVRGTGFLGIRATDGKTHPDDAIWYNPDGSHNEKYDCLTIIKPK